MKTIGLQFSGGKDSLALLHFMRDKLSEMVVFFGDTGAVYPHVKQFVIDTCKELGAELVIVTPPMPVTEYTERYGYPADIVPVERAEAAWMMPKGRTLIQSYAKCCGNMLWAPMIEALKAYNIKTVYRGTKACDPHVTVKEGDIDGIKLVSPLWDWSDHDVMAYLLDKKMPDQYPQIMDSMDCWMCTAHMTGEHAHAKLQYAKKHYPELWPEIVRRVALVQHAITADVRKVNQAFAAIN